MTNTGWRATKISPRVPPGMAGWLGVDMPEQSEAIAALGASGQTHVK